MTRIYLAQIPPAPEAVVSAPTPRVYRGMGSDVEKWRGLVAEHFRAEDVDRVLCLMSFESGGNPDAYNPSGASGLMQVMPSWADSLGYARAALFDPVVNLTISRYLRDNGGWNHWSPYKRGECR